VICKSLKCPNRARRRGYCNKHADLTLTRPQGGLVASTRTRTHIAQLQAAGVTYQLIGVIAGRHRTWVCDVLRRDMVTEATERLVLSIAVPAEPHRLVADGRVLAIGSTRRLQGLVVCGHTQRELANELGWLETNVGTLINGRKQWVTAATARHIADLTDRLQGVPGTSEPARRRAAARGWVPVLAWDEDLIDDPTAQPAPVPTAPASFAERYIDVVSCGETNIEAIAKRLDITPTSVKRQRERHGLGLAS
jgi:hypothetical protein